MKWSKAELINQKDCDIIFHEAVTFDPESFATNYLRDLHEVEVSGNGHYDPALQRFEVDLEISGEMVVPCAVTLEDVVVPFEIASHEVFSFLPSKDEDVHFVKKEILELYPVIFQLILVEIPLKVVKDGNFTYPKGEGWEVIREEDYIRRSKDEIDPRLAKLKEFQFQDD